MKKILISILFLINTSYAQGLINGISGDVPSICRNEKHLNLQIKCMQELIKCLNIHQSVRGVTQKQMAQCILKLNPQDYATKDSSSK